MPWQVLGLTISTRREKLVGTRRNIDCWNKEKYRLIKNRVFKRSKECSNAKCTTLGIIDSAHPNPRSYLAFRKFFVYHTRSSEVGAKFHGIVALTASDWSSMEFLLGIRWEV